MHLGHLRRFFNIMSRSPDEADNKTNAGSSDLQFSCISVIGHGLHEAQRHLTDCHSYRFPAIYTRGLGSYCDLYSLASNPNEHHALNIECKAY